MRWSFPVFRLGETQVRIHVTLPLLLAWYAWTGWQVGGMEGAIAESLFWLFLFLSVRGKGTTVANAYLILLDTMILIYFIPFVYLFLVYLTDKGVREGAGGTWGRVRIKVLGISGMMLTVFAMVVACVPPSDTPSVPTFELKVVGGALLFVLAGGGLFWRARWKGRGA